MISDKRTGKMTRAGKVVLVVMLAIWETVKGGFSDKDLEEFASTMEWPYNEWAREELVERQAASSRN